MTFDAHHLLCACMYDMLLIDDAGYSYIAVKEVFQDRAYALRMWIRSSGPCRLTHHLSTVRSKTQKVTLETMSYHNCVRRLPTVDALRKLPRQAINAYQTRKVMSHKYLGDMTRQMGRWAEWRYRTLSCGVVATLFAALATLGGLLRMKNRIYQTLEVTYSL